MSGLLRRLTKRRAATADETPPQAAGTSDPVDAPASGPAPPGGDAPLPAETAQASGDSAASSADTAESSGETAQPPADTAVSSGETAQMPADTAESSGETAQMPAAAATPLPGDVTPLAGAAAAEPQPAVADLPAGVDPGELERSPAGGSRRGPLRRRLRYLRRVREVLLRDLGGFSYELHRTAAGEPAAGHRRLLLGKAERLAAVDAELHALEAELAEPYAGTVLREPGIGGTCPTCGELYGSQAAYCFACGTPLTERARARRLDIIERAARERVAAITAQREAQAGVAQAAAHGTTPAAAAQPAAAAPPAPEAQLWASPQRAAAAEPAEDSAEFQPTAETPVAESEVSPPESAVSPAAQSELAPPENEVSPVDDAAGEGTATGEPAPAEETARDGSSPSADDQPTAVLGGSDSGAGATGDGDATGDARGEAGEEAARETDGNGAPAARLTSGDPLATPADRRS